MLLSLINICDFIVLTTPTNLDDEKTRNAIIEVNKHRPLTHYMLCESDRLRIEPESIKYDSELIHFKVLQQTSVFDWIPHEVSIPSRIPTESGEVDLELRLDGPTVTLKESNGHGNWFDNTFLFLEFLSNMFGKPNAFDVILKLTVRYIGQTEISDHYVRFDTHEKLNTICNNIIAHRPHREVWVKMMSFQPPSVRAMSLPGIESEYRDDWMAGGGLMENLPTEERTTIIEAALIKYFQPELNKHYKKNFPSDRHKSYKYFYDEGFRSVIVELHEEYKGYVSGNEFSPYTKIKMLEFELSTDGVNPFLIDNSKQDMDEILKNLS